MDAEGPYNPPPPNRPGAAASQTGARIAAGILLLFSILALGLLYLLAYLLQRQAAFFSDFSGGEAQLPAFTRSAIWLADWLEANWYIVIPVWLALAALVSARLQRFATLLAVLLALLMVAAVIAAVSAMQLPVFNLVNVIQ